MIKTAFEKDDENDDSPLFADFEGYRSIIKSRLDNANDAGDYSLNDQEVVIPAFLAAYAGQSPDEVKTTAFPRLPIPGWSFNYRGLTKIAALKDVFSTINFNHSYNSQYSVSNYNNSALYTENLTLDNPLTDVGLANQFNEDGNLVPIFTAQQVVLTERFSPLVGINLRTTSSWNLNIDYSKERNVALNLSNIQVTERSGSDVNITLGYTKAGVKIPFRIRGRKETLPNELRFNMGLRISDSKTVQRRIGESSIVTEGLKIFRLSPTVEYNISEALQVSFYFERNVNEPRVTTSFLNSRTAFGGRIRFSLSQ